MGKEAGHYPMSAERGSILACTVREADRFAIDPTRTRSCNSIIRGRFRMAAQRRFA